MGHDGAVMGFKHLLPGMGMGQIPGVCLKGGGGGGGGGGGHGFQWVSRAWEWVRYLKRA